MKSLLPLLLVTALPVLATTEFTNWYAGVNQYKVARIATDAAGDTFIAGTRTLPASSDIFVIKLDASGNVVLYREISGGGSDQASDMAIDPAGDIYVAGSTTSLYFPAINAMRPAPGPGFLFKISADGSQFLWSTYYREKIAGLAVDSSGNAYVTGSTFDPTYPVTAGLPAGPVSSGLGNVIGAFLTKISATGSGILYSAVISGSGHACGSGSSCFLSNISAAGAAVAVDPAGDAFMAGNTNAATLPVTAGAAIASGTGAFVACIKADGSAMTYLTLVGSARESPGGPVVFAGNTATAIVADKAGNAYLTGSTFDVNFPATTGAYQTTYGGPVPQNSSTPPTDAFVLKLNATGTAIVWASYIGGDGIDLANSISVDSSGQAWIAGSTASTGFPNSQGFIAGSDFLTGFSANGAQLVYSSRFPNDGASQSIAVDPSGFVHVAGPTGTVSTLNPASAPVTKIFGIANSANGPLDAKFAPGEVISIYGPNIGPSTPVIASADSTGHLPAQLAGYQVTMGGSALRLLYVASSQINAVTTYPVNSQLVVIAPSGTTTPVFNTAQVTSNPEIYRNPDNSAIAVNQDGTFNSQTNPAHFGTYEAIWMTGAGGGNGDWGQIATAADDLHCCSVMVNGTLEGAAYSGYSPSVALGVSQVNFLVTTTTAIGSQATPVNLVVTGIDGTNSRAVTLWIQR